MSGFTWHYSPRDPTNVFSLCAGHRYLALEGRYKYPIGKGAFGDLPEADKCAVCFGRMLDKRFKGKPKRSPSAMADQGSPSDDRTALDQLEIEDPEGLNGRENAL